MSDNEEGASPRELVVEACRRDQVHLIESVLADMEDKSNEQVAAFFNGVTDAMGNHALHICAMYGSYDTMDALFDIQGFECDPLTRIDKDTPLHTAVKYANEKDAELGHAMIKMMCEAGCDPRVKNKAGLRPVDMVLPQFEDVRGTLSRTAYMLQEGIFGMDEDKDKGGESDGPSDSE